MSKRPISMCEKVIAPLAKPFAVIEAIALRVIQLEEQPVVQPCIPKCPSGPLQHVSVYYSAFIAI